MGLRETLNKNPAITTGATAAIIIIALIVIIWQLKGDSYSVGENLSWYTIDDGKTWFADDANKVPPFDKDGKKAYRVYVYKCADGTKFVSHLERYTPEAKKIVEEANKKGAAADPSILETVTMNGLEVKNPGNGDDAKFWVKQAQYQAYSVITAPKCPNGGGTDGLEAVPPTD